MAKPNLIVFDLDYTLWPFWVDTHVDPPFHAQNGKVYDRAKREVKYYPEVPQILEHLKREGYILGVASRTSEIQGAKQLMELFKWNKYFTHKEIYPGSKVTHFKRFHEASGIPYKDMLFFDDEHRNIIELNKIGVTAILAPDGMNMSLLNEGLATFKQKKQSL